MDDSLLTVTVVSTDPDLVLELVGDLDLSSIPALRAALESLEPDAVSVVLDLAGLTFLDSSGMGLVAKTNHELQDRGGGIVLRSPRAHVLRTLQMVGLDEVVQIITDDDPSRLAPD
jgi:anti-anti-sigma factor